MEVLDVALHDGHAPLAFHLLDELVVNFNAIKQHLNMIKARTYFILNFEQYEGTHGISNFKSTEIKELTEMLPMLEVYVDYRIQFLENHVKSFITASKNILKEVHQMEYFFSQFNEKLPVV